MKSASFVTVVSNLVLVVLVLALVLCLCHIEQQKVQLEAADTVLKFTGRMLQATHETSLEQVKLIVRHEAKLRELGREVADLAASPDERALFAEVSIASNRADELSKQLNSVIKSCTSWRDQYFAADVAANTAAVERNAALSALQWAERESVWKVDLRTLVGYTPEDPFKAHQRSVVIRSADRREVK